MPKLALPKHYTLETGDTFVRLREIGPIHVGRIFEARNQTDGTGIVGYLEDANHYLLKGTVALRFVDQPLGMFDVPDAWILLKHPKYRLPVVEDETDEETAS